jgi:hypothetical protein
MGRGFSVVLRNPGLDLAARSAPTSAAFVKMPPPTRAKRAAAEAPMPNMTIVVAIVAGSQSKTYLRR